MPTIIVQDYHRHPQRAEKDTIRTLGETDSPDRAMRLASKATGEARILLHDEDGSVRDFRAEYPHDGESAKGDPHPFAGVKQFCETDLRQRDKACRIAGSHKPAKTTRKRASRKTTTGRKGSTRKK